MPWPPQQETAIFMDMTKRKGKAAAADYMSKHNQKKAQGIASVTGAGRVPYTPRKGSK